MISVALLLLLGLGLALSECKHTRRSSVGGRFKHTLCYFGVRRFAFHVRRITHNHTRFNTDIHTTQIILITQFCDEISFFQVRVVSYVFRYADFGENTQKILARTVFTQLENFCMERVNLVVLLISNTV